MMEGTNKVRSYESVCIFAPNLTEVEVDKFTEKFTGVVTSRGGTVLKVERQGLKRFAVPVRRHTEGWHIVWEFEAAPEVVAEVTRSFGVTDVLLRGIVVRKPKASLPPSSQSEGGEGGPAANASPVEVKATPTAVVEGQS